MTFRSDTHPNSVTKKQGARGPLAVGGPALHDSAIFARFYAAGNTGSHRITEDLASILQRPVCRVFGASTLNPVDTLQYFGSRYLRDRPAAEPWKQVHLEPSDDL